LPNARSPVPARRTGAGTWPWLVAGIGGIVTYLATSHGLILFGGAWQVPLFLGLTVGLIAVDPVQGAVLSVACTLGGMLLAAPVLPYGATPGLLEYALAAILAATGGVVPPLARTFTTGRARITADWSIAALLVAWISVNLWMPLKIAQADVFRQVPQAGQYLNDDALYRRVFYLMHDGMPYYRAFRTAWDGLASVPAPPNSPVAFRLPTYFWMWLILPRDSFAILYLFLAFITLGTVAASLIAAQLVGPRLAPLAAIAFAGYAWGVEMRVNAVYVDLPAMSVALAGVALFLWSVRSKRRGLLWAAAATILLAALMREILAYLLVFALLSSFMGEKTGRTRRTIPWLTALGAFVVAYLGHIAATQPYLAPGSGQVSYLQGGIRFAIDGLTHFSTAFHGAGGVLAALVAFGVAGAYASRRRAGAGFSAFALASIIVPFLVMLWIGNPGVDEQGATVNYWGNLVVPLALALWPAAALLIASGPSRTENRP
jgi:hypothetical protein